MIDENAQVISNEPLGESLYLIRLASEGIAGDVEPGQFVHMGIPTLQSHILRRPFSIYDADTDLGTIDILYQVVGTGTAEMVEWREGQKTRLLGPIGNRWHAPEDAKRALIVGGGVGAAPLFMLTKELLAQGIHVDAVLGASTSNALVCRDRYASICFDSAYFATDDGSCGAHGFATVHVEDLLKRDASYDYAAICGPEPFMKAASSMTLAEGIPTQVSLEKRMACGLGACLSCVCDTVDGRKRVCVDGPIFDARKVVW